MTYGTLGAAYDAFGDSTTRSTASPAPGVAARDRPAGFHQVERCCGGDRRRIARRPAAGPGRPLRAAVLGQQQINALDIGLRSHEILEDACSSSSTAPDAGSHTNLATIAANLVGTLSDGARRSPAPEQDPDLAATDRWIGTRSR